MTTQNMNPEIEQRNGENLEDETPLGVKLISISFFVLSILAPFLVSSTRNLPDLADYGYSGELYQIIRCVLVAFSLFFAAIGIFLWRRHNWARLVVIIIMSSLVVLLPLLSFASSASFSKWTIVHEIVSALIFIYLVFSKKVKFIFNSERKLQVWDILVVIGVVVGLIVLGGVVRSNLLPYSAKPENNPYGWKAVVEPTDLEFKRILSYKFGNGLEKLPWTEEANGGWGVTNGSKVIYKRWLKTIYGYPPNNRPVFKIYLEGIAEDTFDNYLDEVEKTASEKTIYNGAWYSLTWDEKVGKNISKESYIIFPDKKLGAFLLFYEDHPLTKMDAEKIIREFIDHVVSLN